MKFPESTNSQKRTVIFQLFSLLFLSFITLNSFGQNPQITAPAQVDIRLDEDADTVNITAFSSIGSTVTLSVDLTGINGVQEIQNVPGTDAIMSLVITPAIGNKGTHTLQITATDSEATPNTSTFDLNLNIYSDLGATISESDTICYGEETQLTFTASGGIQPYSVYYHLNGELGSVETIDGTGNLTINEPATVSVFAIADASGDSTSITGQIAQVTQIPEISPLIEAPVTNFTKSVCSGSYANAPIRLSITPPFTTYNWQYSTDNIDYQTISGNEAHLADSPGYYKVAVTDNNGCSGEGSIELTTVSEINLENSNGLICNGNFENTSNLGIIIAEVVKDSVLSCDGSEVQGSEVNTNFFGLEFTTECRYATKFKEGVPNTFSVNDSLFFIDAANDEQLLYPLMPDTLIDKYGGTGDVLFIKGNANNSCDNGITAEWLQNVQLEKNTNYLLTFMVASVGDFEQNDFTPPVIDFGFKTNDAFVSFIANDYYLNTATIGATVYSVDTLTEEIEHVFGDSIIIEERFTYRIEESNIEINEGLRITQSIKNNAPIWYKVSCRFSSRDLDEMNLSIRNIGTGIAKNIFVLDDISLEVDNRKPKTGGMAPYRVLIGKETFISSSTSESDLHDTLTIEDVRYTAISGFSHTLNRVSQHEYSELYTWTPDKETIQTVYIDANDGHGTANLYKAVRACWDYDLLVGSIHTSSLVNVYAGGDTIDISCRIQNAFLNELTKKATDVPTDFRIDLVTNSGQVVYEIYQQPIGIMQPGDYIEVSTSTVFPKDLFELGGEYKLQFWVDTEDLITCENWEGNNRQRLDISFERLYTDLSISNLNMSTGELLPGVTELSYGFSLENLGTIPRSSITSPSTKVEVYIEGDNGMSHLIDQISTKAPTAKKSTDFSNRTLTIPADIFVSENYFLKIVVDEEEAISAESDRTNNILIEPIKVLEHIEFQGLEESYTFPATDSLKIAFNLKDNNENVDINISISNNITAQGATFTNNAPSNFVECLIEWLPEYSDIGSYTVTISASDALGHNAARSFTLNITDTPPEITSVGERADTIGVMVPFRFTIDAIDKTLGDSITFSISGKAEQEFDAKIVPVTEGNNATAEFQWTPDFSASGLFKTTIIATDRGGLADSVTFNVIVKNLPNAGFNFVSVCDSSGVAFKAAGDGAEYEWSFGDGATLNTSEREIVHQYTDPGKYQVVLTAKDNGVSHSVTKYVTVGTPNAFFGTNDVCEGEVSVFSNVTEGATSYEWDFGDGNAAYEVNPYHVYESGGDTSYTCTLTVSIDGCTDTYSKTINVAEGVDAVIESSDNGELVCEGTELTFSAAKSKGALTYSWNFGDTASKNLNSSRKAEVLHTYGSGGTFQVGLTVTNGRCSDKDTRYVTVEPRPQLEIEGASFLCETSGEVLTGKISNISQNSYREYQWLDINNEKIGASRTLLVNSEGTYKLIIGNTCGVSDTAIHEIKRLDNPMLDVTLVSGTTCSDTSNGIVSLEIHPSDTAEGPYVVEYGSESFNTSDTLFQISGLAAGRHYFKVSNHVGCESTTGIYVSDNGPYALVETRPSGCDPENGTGVIEVSMGNGATPFDVNWDGPMTGNANNINDTLILLEGLVSGRYNINVTDDHGCLVSKRNLIISQPALSISVPVVPSCGNDPIEVSASATLSGADTSSNVNPSFEYTWFKLDTVADQYVNQSINGADCELESGTYRLWVNETNFNCLDSSFFEIEKGKGLIARITGDAPLCWGDSSATLKVDVSGNTGHVNYHWATPTDTALLSSGALLKKIPAGTYIAEATDERGCIAADTITIEQPEEIIVNNFIGSICTATVDVTPKNNYVFSWIRLDSINGELKENTVLTTSNSMAVGLSQGQYYVMAQNLEGCSGKTADIGVIEGRQEPRTFKFHMAYKNPVQEPLEEEYEETDVTQIVADMKLSITTNVSSCQANVQGNVEELFEELCFSGKHLNDAVEIEYLQPFYHYTLYYYDRANNLTKTVPPEGVRLLNDEEIAQIVDYRDGGSGSMPDVTEHAMATSYNYSGLNQLTDQQTPDAGVSGFIYDNLSRLRFSQNAQQKADAKFSYTKYDELGRIIEVGQSVTNNFLGLQDHADDATYPAETGTDLTLTTYTKPASGVGYYGSQQRYLNNRVSYTYTDKDGDTTTTYDQSRTYYSYDPHGNVEWLIQDVQGLGKNYVKYTYDLISGNVLQVAFNEYRTDKFFHKYTYDEDNRLLAVYTSDNGVTWDRDAGYNYYAHGPLRRMELGEDKVQGIDYTYTLQGWLKALNHPGLTADADPGKDGGTGSDVAADVFGMSLGYYEGDFKRTDSEDNTLFEDTRVTGATNLYNGNISSWATQTRGNDVVGTYNDRMTGHAYTYDKLNRIKFADFYHFETNWQNSDVFDTRYTYDANGNILNLTRNSDSTSRLVLDDLVYEYLPGTNKLVRVSDVANNAANGKFGDLASDPNTNISHNYTYDHIGNLIIDEGYEMMTIEGGGKTLHEVITRIGWNVYGKIDSVEILRKEIGAPLYDTTRIYYAYGPDGNRIVKDVYAKGSDPESRTTTFYVRDASGNIMGTYKRTNGKVDGEDNRYRAVFAMSEQPIYGSSRLGVRNGSNDTLFSAVYTPGDNQQFEILTDPSQGKAGLHNWISPTVAMVDINENTNLCNCQVRNINFDAYNTFQSDANAASFMGYAKNNVALAEDFSGNLLFYSVVASDYFGNSDVCLVYDRSGVLMRNSFGIKSSAYAKPMVVKSQGDNNKYFLITIGDDHKPYYHVIDMAQTGYGEGYVAGGVVSKNIPLDNGSKAYYGFHMSVIEDNAKNKSLVYTTRYIEPVTQGLEGRTELVVFDFMPNQSSSPEPEVLTSVAGFDKYGEGELQLSPFGDRLAYYNRKRGIAGFAHQEVELHVFGLGTDRKSIDTRDTLSIQGSTAGTAGKSSIEFYNNNLLLFTQDGLYLNPETGSEKSVWTYRFDTRQLTMLPVATSGDLRRGLDDEIYLAAKDADNKLYKLTDLLTTPQTDSTSVLFNTGTAYSGLTGGLPMQAYRIAPTAQGNMARKVGFKQYELTDHLGNVRAVVSDALKADATSGTVETKANVLAYNNYYAFGMLQPNRTYNGGNYRFGFNGMEMDNELSGTGNSYTTHFRQYDPRIGRWLSIDPLTAKLPWQSPYISMDNNPITLTDPDGDCATCPKEGNVEGQEFTTEGGNSFIFSSNHWTPASEHGAWQNGQSGGAPTMSYFDYYSGKHGYDPTRADWDNAGAGNSIEKLNRAMIFKNLYNNDVADNFMWHYAYGNGADYNLSLEDFKQGAGIRQTLGIQSFSEGKAAITKALELGKTTPINYVKIAVSTEKQVYAVHAGTLGNYTVKIQGNISLIAKNAWVFQGTLSIMDTYDFNVANRPGGDEADVSFARENLWGAPFKVQGSYPVSQTFYKPIFNIYDGMERKNIISNRDKFNSWLEEKRR